MQGIGQTLLKGPARVGSEALRRQDREIDIAVSTGLAVRRRPEPVDGDHRWQGSAQQRDQAHFTLGVGDARFYLQPPW